MDEAVAVSAGTALGFYWPGRAGAGAYFNSLTWKMKLCREMRAASSPLVLDS